MDFRLRLATIFFVFASSACSSPPAEPIENAELARRVHARGAGSEYLVETLQFQLAATGEPDWDSYWPDIRSGDLTARWQVTYWDACALAWEPNLRQSRWAYEAARHRADAAGFPGPIGASYRGADFSDADLSNEVVGTFDLLGIVGIGPSAAASELADAQVRAARGAFEVAVWQARFAVLRELVRLATVRGELSDMSQHAQAAAKSLRRGEILLKHGRLPTSAVARMQTFVDSLEAKVAELQTAESRRRSALARAAGLLPEFESLDQPNEKTLDQIERHFKKLMISADLARLLEQHPELRRLRLEYAVAEARVRRAAAEAWPKINVGPRFDIQPDTFLTGGVFRLSLPWPGSTEGLVQAALTNRSATRDRLEDALVVVKGRLSAAAAARNLLQRSLTENSIPAYSSSASTWRGLQARFQVTEGSWDLWTDALQLRRNAITGYWKTRQDAALAAIAEAKEGAREGGDHE